MSILFFIGQKEFLNGCFCFIEVIASATGFVLQVPNPYQTNTTERGEILSFEVITITVI